jgi:hypothetical protein
VQDAKNAPTYDLYCLKTDEQKELFQCMFRKYHDRVNLVQRIHSFSELGLVDPLDSNSIWAARRVISEDSFEKVKVRKETEEEHA